MQPGRLGRRRNTHQAIDYQTMLIAHASQKAGQFDRSDPGLLRFFARINLDQKPRRATAGRHCVAQSKRQLIAIERFDDIEQLHGLVRLVALQRPDQAQLQIRKGGTAVTPVGVGLLDTVFTENTLTSLERCDQGCVGLAFRDGDEGNIGRIASGLLRGSRKLCEQVGAACRDIRRFFHDAAI